MTEKDSDPYNLKNTPSDLNKKYRELKQDMDYQQQPDENEQQEAVKNLVQTIKTMNLLYHYLKGSPRNLVE